MQHLAQHLRGRFERMDLLAFRKFYAGSGPEGVSVWHKARKGARELFHRGVVVSEQGGERAITVRDVPAPAPLDLVYLDLWRFARVGRSLAQRYDICLFGDPENAWLARLLQRTGRVSTLIYDDWDYFPGLAEGRLARRLTEHRERACVRSADAVLSINRTLGALRTIQGAKKVLVVPNGVEVDTFGRAMRRRPHPPTLVYMGTLSRLWRTELTIQAMPRIMERVPHVRLLIAGSGPAERELRALSQSLGVSSRVRFLGLLEPHELPGLLAECDVGLATSDPESSFRKYASPLKVLEYMAAGLPVVATRMGEMEVALEESGGGTLIGDTKGELADAASALLLDETFYRCRAQAAHEYARRFSWAPIVDRAFEQMVEVHEHASGCRSAA